MNTADRIATEVLSEFKTWPKKYHPVIRSEYIKEWVPLGGIVIQDKDNFKCVAAATGMKCLPHDKIGQTQGMTLHDWHAEILAIRSFNNFLLKECLSMASTSSLSLDDEICQEKTTSKYLRRRTQNEITEFEFQPFALRDDLLLHMYCSEAPCGDASMELIMASQNDSTPWEIPPSQIHKKFDDKSSLLYGRSYFSNLGCIRRKPSRSDAPLSLSKSCSDKLALKQYMSLLSSLTSLFISPKNMYLSSLILPATQYHKVACDRAFSATGRLMALQRGNDMDVSQRFSPTSTGGYRFQPFSVYSTSLEFIYSRRQSSLRLLPGESLVASNIASFSTPYNRGVLIGGTLQGRKQFSLRGAPPMSKHQMWQLALEVASRMELRPLIRALEKRINITSTNNRTYEEMKCTNLLAKRHEAKSHVRCVLGGDAGEKGWVRNTGGENWSLCDIHSE
ncbi:tRNA-specific adenosine deaminase 1 [Erysiphe neolycopersici]|uniref:tRNA-specific adenosine deaminase 1 n=1 Tax=Erysiphe neolycopersici TaxID=212602 RepID=A0A420H6T3_9PEZI|nr:tRNA-specific adenosine deaminase 1 [Erysiphe neolycopersici]